MKQPFFNIELDVTTSEEVMGICREYFTSKGVHSLFFLNAHCFNIAQKDSAYREAVNNADLLLNDGIGIKLASLIKGIPLKENLNGTDLIPRIITLAEKHHIRVFLLGGKEHVPGKAARKLAQSHPGLEIAGWYSGFFTKDKGPAIIDMINNSGTDLLILGMGVPRQELWVAENKSLLKNVKLIIAGGAILDFISGEIKRAPVWLRKLNMEWAYRLYLEPGRMWKRYLIGNNVFFINIFRLMFN